MRFILGLILAGTAQAGIVSGGIGGSSSSGSISPSTVTITGTGSACFSADNPTLVVDCANHVVKITTIGVTSAGLSISTSGATVPNVSVNTMGYLRVNGNGFDGASISTNFITFANMANTPFIVAQTTTSSAGAVTQSMIALLGTNFLQGRSAPQTLAGNVYTRFVSSMSISDPAIWTSTPATPTMDTENVKISTGFGLITVYQRTIGLGSGLTVGGAGNPSTLPVTMQYAITNVAGALSTFETVVSTGWVGFGTSAPTSRLHVLDNTSSIPVSLFSGNASTAIVASGWAPFAGRASADSGAIQLGSTNADAGVIEYDGSANTTLNIYNTYNSNSARTRFLMKTGGGTVTTPLLMDGFGNVSFMSDGSATASTFTATGDLNMGANGDVNVTGATGYVTGQSSITTTGGMFATTAVFGVSPGTATLNSTGGLSLQNTLTISNAKSLRLQNATNDGTCIYNNLGTTGNAQFDLACGGFQRLSMKNDGTLGIGTTAVSTVTSSGQLQVSNGTGTNATPDLIGGIKVSSVSSCGTAALPAGGGHAGQITTAGTVVATCSITWTPAFPTGSLVRWVNTSRALTINTIAEGVGSSTVTWSGNWTAGDKIDYEIIGY